MSIIIDNLEYNSINHLARASFVVPIGQKKQSAYCQDNFLFLSQDGKGVGGGFYPPPPTHALLGAPLRCFD